MNTIGLKNVLLIVLAAVIIGGAFLFSNYESGADTSIAAKAALTNVSPIVSVATTTPTIGTIAYNDNWQETLSDAATSSSWLDPSSASTADYFDPGQTVTGVTAVVGKNLFAGYIAAKENGEDTSATDTQDEIAGQTLSDGTLLSSPKVYDKSDIIIGSDTSIAALTAYGNAVGEVFKKDLLPTAPNELTIVQASLDKNDPTILKQLDPIIASYQAVIQGLLAVKVPAVLTSFHINIINAMSEMEFVDEDFTKVFVDGITALQGVSLFKKSATDLGNSVSALATYFATANITFAPNEPGSIFTIPSK